MGKAAARCCHWRRLEAGETSRFAGSQHYDGTIRRNLPKPDRTHSPKSNGRGAVRSPSSQCTRAVRESISSPRAAQGAAGFDFQGRIQSMRGPILALLLGLLATRDRRSSATAAATTGSPGEEGIARESDSHFARSIDPHARDVVLRPGHAAALDPHQLVQEKAGYSAARRQHRLAAQRWSAFPTPALRPA